MEHDGDARTLTVEQVALALGVSRNLAYEAVRRGEISSFKVGRRILISKVVLERMLEAGQRRSE